MPDISVADMLFKDRGELLFLYDNFFFSQSEIVGFLKIKQLTVMCTTRSERRLTGFRMYGKLICHFLQNGE